MNDDELLAAVKAAFEAEDRAPDEVVLAARTAFAFRAFDAELATLVADSLTSSVQVRADGPARLLSFEAARVGIDVDVTPRAGVCDVHGVLHGSIGGDWTVAVQDSRGSTTVEVDDAGRFEISGVLAGPVRFTVTTPDEALVVTSWVTV